MLIRSPGGAVIVQLQIKSPTKASTNLREWIELTLLVASTSKPQDPVLKKQVSCAISDTYHICICCDTYHI